MVHSDFPSELVNNGVEDSTPEKSHLAWKASDKGAGSDSSDEEKEGITHESKYDVKSCSVQVRSELVVSTRQCLLPSSLIVRGGRIMVRRGLC